MLFPGSRERNEAGQNGYDDEACRHGKDVAGVVAPGAGQHSQQEDAKQGSVRVAEDAESNLDDAHFRMMHYVPGRDGAHHNEQQGKSHRAPPHALEQLAFRGVRLEDALVPVLRGGGCQGVERCGQGAHGGCKQPGQ